jgi:hypothetical protein
VTGCFEKKAEFPAFFFRCKQEIRPAEANNKKEAEHTVSA